MKNSIKFLSAVCILALSACSERPVPKSEDASASGTPSTAEVVSQGSTPASPTPPDSAGTGATPAEPVKANDDHLGAWNGKWTGPEGTYLHIQRSPDGSYALKLADLDGEKAYTGTGKDDERIEFTRNGKTETIRATDGDGTGMKWLAGKKDCLSITKGAEGYCRG